MGDAFSVLFSDSLARFNRAIGGFIMDTKYNGWTNYETWAWKLWMDNDEGTYDHWQDQARQCFEDTRGDDDFDSRIDEASIDLADIIKSDCEENSPEVTGAYADLLNAAISEIDWHEIASSILEDLSDDLKKDLESAE